MKLSQFQSALSELDSLKFKLPNGEFIPKHFHITEVGRVTKDFIDCGGTLRSEVVINLQLWVYLDINHRLAPSKLSDIVSLSVEKLQLPDAEIEVEYQSDTISKYGLDFDGQVFNLTSLKTDCLAKSSCLIPLNKKSKIVVDTIKENKCCISGSGCC